MAEGVRVEPRAELDFPAGSLVVVVDHDRPILPALDNEGRIIPLARTQPECAMCGYQHFAKTYHIRLDGDGTTIVSPGVWAGLQRCVDNPFVVANPVGAPPKQELIVPSASLNITSMFG